eukprot:2053499-Prymnesium_polylepis.1
MQGMANVGAVHTIAPGAVAGSALGSWTVQAFRPAYDTWVLVSVHMSSCRPRHGPYLNSAANAVKRA